MKILPRACALFVLLAASAAAETPDGLDGCNVVWTAPGKNYRDSMPIGNGDLGLNVWTEPNGDLVFLIGKTDAYTENGQLVKLGRVRVSLTPNPFAHAAGFQQELKLRAGEIEICGGAGGASMRVWVDANHPVAHVEVTGGAPTELQASVELWRLQPRETQQEGKELFGRGVFRELNGIPDKKIIIEPDTVLPAKGNALAWGHRNERSIYPVVFENQHLASLLPKYPDPLLHRMFGASLSGPGLVSADDRTLRSARPASSQRLDLFALTQQTDSVEAWRAALDKTAAAVPPDLETARRAHADWWRAFWDRSWINVTGSEEARQVTQGYAMQRYMDACGGRGALPIKYNGSIFTVGQEPPPGTPYDPAKGQTDADFRFWGGNSWFQNTRLVYWPMIAAGDFDLLTPFFKQYLDSLALETDRTRLYFHHDGAAFPETLYFWGLPGNGDFGWGNPENMIRNTWIRHYVSGSLELTAMMLDRYDTAPDPAFARQTLLPLATAVTTYYDQHWKRGADGKIRFDPAQSLETRQQAVNPTPDIAGLMAVLPRLLALPINLTTDTQRTMWKRTLADLPPIPLGKTGPDGKIPEEGKAAPDGKPIILPAEKYSRPGNVENTEMYAVFPYHQYGVGLPDLELARDTYAAKLFKSSTCWGHDGLDAAVLGLAATARAEVTANFTAYGGERFKWFWKEGHDAEPDMDNGGAGMSILQLMLLQTVGGKTLAFPAWPKDWNVDFKLRAPGNRVIRGVYRDGRLQSFSVLPPAREGEIILMSPLAAVPAAFDPGRAHSDAGETSLATAVDNASAGRDFAGNVPAVSHSRWQGFERLDFRLDGRPCLLIVPATPAPGKPWIWRTEFFGTEPQGDLALAASGYHVAYVDMQNLYGAPPAMAVMDRFYEHVTKNYGLARQCVLEGFSRGGLFAFNWAARVPGQVNAIYADAPVCDFKSWPGGKGKGDGSPDDWNRCKMVYGLTDEQAIAYRFNPVDNLLPLAQAKIPIIAVCGDADTGVPPAENIQLVEKRYREMGGEIQVIVKPGVGHHPHSLPDPKPIVDFILAHQNR